MLGGCAGGAFPSLVPRSCLKTETGASRETPVWVEGTVLVRSERVWTPRISTGSVEKEEGLGEAGLLCLCGRGVAAAWAIAVTSAMAVTTSTEAAAVFET